MENYELHAGYPYEFDILIDPKHLATCNTNFRGHLIFHDTITNIFIFQENRSPAQGEKSPAEAVSEAANSHLNLRLIRGDCITNCRQVPPLLHVKDKKNDIRKEWESFVSRKAGEQCVEDNGQKAFNILSERFGEDAKWQGSDIVVGNQVRVTKPYLPENVIQEPATLLEEVKRRLKEKDLKLKEEL